MLTNKYLSRRRQHSSRIDADEITHQTAAFEPGDRVKVPYLINRIDSRVR